MNQCILTGHLGADPDVRYSQNGDPIATFNLAFRLSKEKTGWIKVVCFNSFGVGPNAINLTAILFI